MTCASVAGTSPWLRLPVPPGDPSTRAARTQASSSESLARLSAGISKPARHGAGQVVPTVTVLLPAWPGTDDLRRRGRNYHDAGRGRASESTESGPSGSAGPPAAASQLGPPARAGPEAQAVTGGRWRPPRRLSPPELDSDDDPNGPGTVTVTGTD